MKIIGYFIFILMISCSSYVQSVRRVGDRRMLNSATSTQSQFSGPPPPDDCTTSLEDSSSVVCRSLIPCANELFYRQFTRITFDLPVTKYFISKFDFNNCQFSQTVSGVERQIEIIFLNVQDVRALAFHRVDVDTARQLLIKFDGKDSTTGEFLLAHDAFRSVHMNTQSQLTIEIMNYKKVLIEDSLIGNENTILQDKSSTVRLHIHDCDSVSMRPGIKSISPIVAIKDLEDESEPHDLLDHNKTYSLQVIHVDHFRLEAGIFSQLQIMPYSSVSIDIRSAYSCLLMDAAFERLMIGTSARFNLLVQNVNVASLGKNLFAHLQQSALSGFLFQMDQIGRGIKVARRRKKKSLSKEKKLNQYYEEEENGSYDDDQDDYSLSNNLESQDFSDENSYEETSNSTSNKSPSNDDEASFLFDEWFCVPEFLFKNVEQSESSTGQFHLTRFQQSISFSSLSFSEFQLSENSKFQIVIQDMRGHIFLESKSIDLIRLSDGIFELWIENHSQLIADKGNRQRKPFSSNRFQSKQTSSDLSYQNQSPLNLMKKALNTHLKLNDLAFNKIFLTSRSLFRIGFINSNSIFLVSPKALNGFHEDEMNSSPSSSSSTNSLSEDDYRTRISFEIKKSDNIHFEFVTQQDLIANEEDLSHFPKLIELDGYRPELNTIDNYKTLLIESDIVSKQLEFCRFFKLRPLLAPLKYKLPNAQFTASSLIFFTESLAKPSNSTCTSCLFIYLYRTIHRRHDFYYLKDHLPKCFINLHFGTNLYLVYKKTAIKSIEDSFLKYWSQLRCDKITGMSSIFQYNVYLTNETASDEEEALLDTKQAEFIGDETYGDFERISKHCRKVHDSAGTLMARNDEEIRSIFKMTQEKWHDTARRICTQNLMDASINSSRTNNNVKIGLKKWYTIDSKRNTSGVRQFSWPLFFSMFFLFGCVTVMIGLAYLKYKPSLRHIWSQMKRKNKFEQLNNELAEQSNCAQKVGATRKKSTGVIYNKMVKQIDTKLAEDDDEYDAEEEIHFDELNNYEYDDEFGLSTSSSAGAAAASNTNETVPNLNENIPFSSAHTAVNSLTVKLKQLKTNLFNKNLLKSSLLPFTSNLPHYSYNSTDSTLVQIMSAEQATEQTEQPVHIVYDIEKKQASHMITTNTTEQNQQMTNKLRLANNPLNTYLDKIEMDLVKKTNESDA